MAQLLPCLSRISRDYVAIWGACAAVGGLSPMRDVLRRVPAPVADELMQRVNSGAILVCPLHHVLWMPNFQFDDDGVLRPGVAGAIAALKCSLDLVEITLWFCTPNGYLDGLSPMQQLGSRPEAVVEAARRAVCELADVVAERKVPAFE